MRLGTIIVMFVHNIALLPIWDIMVNNNRSPLRSYGSCKLTLANYSRTVDKFRDQATLAARETKTNIKQRPRRTEAFTKRGTNVVYDVSLIFELRRFAVDWTEDRSSYVRSIASQKALSRLNFVALPSNS